MVKRSELELAKAGLVLKGMEASGIHLFPLRGISKHPRDIGFQTNAYPMNWARYLKNANIGALCGPDDLFMDIDPDRGGLTSFKWLCFDADTDFTAYPRVMSGKGDGGFHVYMKKPVGFLTKWQMPEYPGIDFQAFMRLVVAPGSLHPKTLKPYRLLGEWHTPTLAPQGLLDRIAKPPRVSSGGVAGAMTFKEIAEALGKLKASDFGTGGPHHDEWLSIAMAVHHGSGGDDEARDIWLDWCATDDRYGDEARDMNERRWESFDALLDSSSSDAVTYKTLLMAVARAGEKTWVARLHEPSAASEWEDDEEPKDAMLKRVGATARKLKKLKKTRG